MAKLTKQGSINFGGLIQCTTAYINELKQEDIQEGTLYFVLDTKQVLLSKTVLDEQTNTYVKKLIPMGSETRVRFAKMPTDLNNLNENVTFKKEFLEDKSCYPQIDDLIFNEDGCFYRVLEIDREYIRTKRLTVAGSGGGGGGGGSSSNSSSTVDPYFKEYNMEGVLPQYIIMGDPENPTYPLSHTITASLNNRPLSTIKQTVKIYNGEDVEYSETFTISPGGDKQTVIPLKNEWFKSGGLKSVEVVYTYSTSRPFSVPLGDVLVFDLSVNQDIFKANTVFKDSDFKLTANIKKVAGATHKIYLELMRDAQEVIDSYPSGLTVEYDSENPNKIKGRYFIPDSQDFSPQFSRLTYGNYTIKFYHVIEYEGMSFKGPEYIYDFLCLSTNNPYDTPQLLCDFSGVDNKEFSTADTIFVPVLVYDPYEILSNKKSDGNLEYGYIKLNGQEQPLSPDGGFTVAFGDSYSVPLRRIPAGEQQQIYIKYEYTRNGQKNTLKQTCRINVIEKISSKAEPIVVLTPVGRTNSEKQNIDLWVNDSKSGAAPDFKTTFSNFTWSDQEDKHSLGGTGWCRFNGVDVLRVGQDAKVDIDYNPYALNFTSSESGGLSLIFDYSVRAYSIRKDSKNPILQCFNPKGYGFRAFGDYIQFKTVENDIKLSVPDNQKVNIAITITPIETHKNADGKDEKMGLVSIYLDGILSFARTYKSVLSDFSKTIFKIGNDTFDSDFYEKNDSIIDIYSIEVYNRCLSSSDVVQQYLEKNMTSLNYAELLQKNNIYDNGVIRWDYVRDNGKIPVMIITGTLPENKQDKTKKVGIDFYHPLDSSKNFSQSDVQIEVQGTSSQFYPVKNWKLKKLKPNGDSGYILEEGQVKTSTFCLKADYAESTGTHNTQNAKLVESLYSKIGAQKTPAQVFYDENCRTTIYGYPMVVFHRKTAQDSAQLLGKYNFNFDKGSKEVFGFGTKNKKTGEPIQGECWEFKDNDAIAGMEPNGIEEVGFAWDKWQVTYTSTQNTDKKTIYLPEDDDLDRGWVEERHTNVDAVREKAKEYLARKKSDRADPDYEWWSRASLEADTMLPMWCKYFEPRYCDKKIVDKDGNVVTYKTGAQEIVGFDELTQTDILEDEYEEVCDISNFAQLYDWIMSTAIKETDSDEVKEQKLNEFENNVFKKFDEKYLLFYYTYTFMCMMVDQRAKNMFFTYWEPIPQLDENGEQKVDKDTGELLWYGGKWQPWFYDNDTCLGIDNSGFEKHEYDSEDDVEGSLKNVFQGDESVLWTNLKARKSSAIESMYRSIRNAGVDAKLLNSYFIDTTKAWSASVYNEDSARKYISYAYSGVSYVLDGEEQQENVIEKLRGDGVFHGINFIKDRINYCDKKWNYVSSQTIAQTLRMRPNTETHKSDVLMIDIIPFSTGNYAFLSGADMTVTGKNLFNAYNIPADKKGAPRMENGKLYSEEYSFDGATENNVAYFLNAADIVYFGGDNDLIKWGEFQGLGVSTKLKTLLVGNKNNLEVSHNNKLTDFNGNFSIDVGGIASPVLDTIDVSNTLYNNGASALDLSSCPNVRKIYARNSQISNIIYPTGGYLEDLYLSDTVSTFNIIKQIELTEDKVIFENSDKEQGIHQQKNPYRNLQEIIIEDCPKFNSRAFLTKCLKNNSEIPNYNIPDDNTVEEKIIRVTNIDYKKDSDGKPLPIKTKTYKRDSIISKEEYDNIIKLFATQEDMDKFSNSLDIVDSNSYKFIQETIVPEEYDPWVFLCEQDFIDFANLFKNSPFPLVGKNDLKLLSEKPFLKGQCYILGNVTGNNKDILRNCIEGEFEILSNPAFTEYVIKFYRLDPDPRITNPKEKRQPIKNLDGSHYIQIIKEGQQLKNPYAAGGDWYGIDGVSNNNFVPEFSHDGTDYTHSEDKNLWMLYPCENDEDIPQEVKSETSVFSTKIYRVYDVYAVYSTYTPRHNVQFWRGPNLENAELELVNLAEIYDEATDKGGIWHGESYPAERLPKRGKVPYWDPKYQDDWEFNEKWIPAPINIKQDTICVAQYDYIALQTHKILDKSIQSCYIGMYGPEGNEKYLTEIPSQAFKDCKNLVELILDVNTVVKLKSTDAFEGTPLLTSGCIKIPKGMLSAYEKAENWKDLNKEIFEEMEE